MSDLRCHWWDAERGYWVSPWPNKLSRMVVPIQHIHKCPYCGAALPEAGPEEDGDE